MSKYTTMTKKENDNLNYLVNKTMKLSFSNPEMKNTIKDIEKTLKKKNILRKISKEVVYNSYSVLGYYFGKTHDYHKSIFWLNKLGNENPDWKLFKDSLFPTIINNVNEERNVVNNLITQFNNYLNVDVVMSVSNIMSLNHSFWYAYIDNNPKELYEKYALIQQKAFPSLSNNNYSISNFRSSSSKIRLGIISQGLVPRKYLNDKTVHSSSISDSFYSTLLDLDKNKFELIFIYYGKENVIENVFIESSNNEDLFIPNLSSDPNSILKWQKKIADLNLDILLYLDIHIEPNLNWFAQSKLAKIQIATHGHPVTSGIPKNIMNYFISWEAAEIDTAQDHYTEELILIPKNIMWERFIPRNNDKTSMLTGKSWKDITRNYFKTELKNININSNWYFCSQATFKLNYNFDSIIKRIIEKDSNAEFIMIHVDKELFKMKELFIKRLENNNINLNKIHFIKKMPHHIMMAMYNVTDVALDSFFFGGDTTTREAFEIGTPIVTLPHKYLGSRWTFAYYNHIGILDLIAKNEEDYVNIAVNIATNKNYANDIRNRIRENSHKIFYSTDASKAWGNILEKVYNKLPIRESNVDTSDTVHKIDECTAMYNGIDLSEMEAQQCDEKEQNVGLKGGSDLMKDRIQDILDLYKDKFNIILNRFNQKETIDSKKQNIYWCEDNEGDPLYDLITKDDIFVFVTEYQKRNFIEYYDIDPSKCHVIKNAIVPIEKHVKQNDTCRLIYMSTPNRGLDILVTVFEKLVPIFEQNNIPIHLDIYSSFKIYGRSDLDNQFKHLYDKIQNHKNMTYHGSVTNNTIREALKNTHIFTYPSTFKETSCLCLIEAMSAGCVCVHSSLGALPDTANRLTHMYEYSSNKMEHCSRFASKLIEAVSSVKTSSREYQINYIKTEHNIENIRQQWSDLLKSYSEKI